MSQTFDEMDLEAQTSDGRWLPVVEVGRNSLTVRGPTEVYLMPRAGTKLRMPHHPSYRPLHTPWALAATVLALLCLICVAAAGVLEGLHIADHRWVLRVSVVWCIAAWLCMIKAIKN